MTRSDEGRVFCWGLKGEEAFKWHRQSGQTDKRGKLLHRAFSMPYKK